MAHDAYKQTDIRDTGIFIFYLQSEYETKEVKKSPLANVTQAIRTGPAYV